MSAVFERAPADTRTQLWRIGALALFCGLPILLVSLGAANLLEASAARRLAAREDATVSQIVKQVARRRTRSMTPADTASLYLASRSASLARAELQAKLEAAVTAAGGRLVEAQFTGSGDAEAAGTIAIQLTLDIGNKGLLDLLYALETTLPLLQPTALVARSDAAGSDADVGPGPSGQAGLLHVELTIDGFWRKAEE